MSRKSLRRISPWFVVTILALVLGTGGGAVAARLITSADIANGTIQNRDIKVETVRTNRLHNGTILNEDLATDTIQSDKIAASAVTASELAGTTLVSANQAIAAGASGSVSVPCPAGTQVLNGGGTASSYAVFAVSSFQSGNGWIWAAHNSSAVAQSITVYASCLAAPAVSPKATRGPKTGSGNAARPPRLVRD